MLHLPLTSHHYRRAILVLCVALSTTFALGLDPHKDLRQYGRRSWQTDSGLPQDTVHSVLQTSDGYIWLATEGGLVRFDGVQFVVYDKQAPAHLPSVTVNSLFEDSTGSLWIATEGGLVRYRNNVFTSFGDADGLPSSTIWSVFQDASGSVWIVTPDGIARFLNGRFEAANIQEGVASPKSVAMGRDGSVWVGTHSGLAHLSGISAAPCRSLLRYGRACEAPALSGVEVQSVAATSDGRVWAATRSGLYRIDPRVGPKEAGNITPFPGLPSNEITSLTVARDGSLWVGTAQGVAVIRDKIIALYGTRDGLPDDRVESIAEDREGARWIATSRGLARIFDGRVETLTRPDRVSDSVVLSVLEDREGSLWLGTESGGLEMLHNQKFTTYTTVEGLSDDHVRSVLQDRDGVVWVGTAGGGLDRFDHGRFTSLTTSDGLSSNIVLALGSDSAGDLWVGTPDGLNRIRHGKPINVFTSADGLADDFVRSIYAASDGSMWIGTRRGLSHLQGGRFTNYSSLDGLGSDLIGAIVEDNQHALWIGTLGGLTRFDHAKFTTFTMRDDLSSNVITALYQDRENTLWIGTNQGGLNRLRDAKITTYPLEDSHLPESVYAILEDTRGNLWLSSKTGIYSVSKKQLNDFAGHPPSPITPTAYGTADGMKISEGSSGGHPAAWKLADRTMWFATLKGVAAVDPEDLTANTIPPPIAIEEVLIDDRPVDSTAALTVAPGKGRFEFHYAGLSFIAPQKVRFRYKLEGFDREWVDAGNRRTAYYTNLPPRKYRFRVLACNNDGVWNETGASLDLQLEPHYYQTYWFYLLLALGLALLAYCIYRWRLRLVEARYDAVLAERGRIAREIHDTLAQGLVGISVQLELVNRLLASSVESARTQLDHARNLVRGSITEARSSIWELRSQAAETEDLATRLTRMAATATENSTPAIRVKSKVSGAYRPLAPKTEGELLRIAQEAVTNAVRHAKPNHIAIELRFGAHELQLTIQDDGRGFDGRPHPQSTGPQGHFGITGMSERAEQIGGTLIIDSAPGKGTRVTASVPLQG